MINSIKKSLRGNAFSGQKFREIIGELHAIRKRSNEIVICLQPIDGNWLGVNIATKKLFDNNCIDLPHHYSSSVFNAKQTESFLQELEQQRFEQIVFSGIPAFFLEIIEKLVVRLKDTRIKLIYHGTTAELTSDPKTRNAFNRLRESTILGEVVLGFVHEPTLIALGSTLPLKTKHIIPVETTSTKHKITSTDQLDIGCFGTNNFNKNIGNQVIACQTIDNCSVHTISDHDFLSTETTQVIRHNRLPREDFIELIGRMKINLHASFSESWGQLISESIMFGVPCITGLSNTVYNFNTTLKTELSILDITNPTEIKNKVLYVDKNIEQLRKNCFDYHQELQQKSQELLKSFMND